MIGIAVIGLGNALEPHAKALQDLTDRARVVWAAARSDAAVSAAAAKFGFPTTTDIDLAITDRAVDAVLVLTPANAHLPIAEAAFAAGKHVLCEKPLEASLERAEQLIAAGRDAGRKLGIVLQARFRAGSRRLKQVLDEGLLGEGPGRIDEGAVVAAAGLLRSTRPRRESARRRRRADHPGDPHARPVPLVRRRCQRRSGADPHDGSASHGNRGLRRCLGAPRQRCAGHHHGDHRRLARQPGMHHHHRHAGHRAAGGRQPAPVVARWARGGAWSMPAAPAAAPT